MLYMNFMVITNQKSIIDKQKRKRKASKHNPKESPQIRREESKTIRKPNERPRLRPHLSRAYATFVHINKTMNIPSKP